MRTFIEKVLRECMQVTDDSFVLARCDCALFISPKKTEWLDFFAVAKLRKLIDRSKYETVSANIFGLFPNNKAFVSSSARTVIILLGLVSYSSPRVFARRTGEEGRSEAIENFSKI